MHLINKVKIDYFLELPDGSLSPISETSNTIDTILKNRLKKNYIFPKPIKKLLQPKYCNNFNLILLIFLKYFIQIIPISFLQARRSRVRTPYARLCPFF